MNQTMPSFPQRDPYRILGVSPDATMEQIHKAYFSLAREYDPAKNPDALQKLRVAYRQLRIQKQANSEFLGFPEVKRDAEFRPASNAVVDVEDDFMDLEMWRLTCKPVEKN